MIEESAPLALTAYRPETLWPCVLIRVQFNIAVAAAVFYLTDPPDSSRCLDTLANAIFAPGWGREVYERYGCLKGNERVNGHIYRMMDFGHEVHPPSCHVVFDYAEVMHMFDMINMGESPFVDVSLQYGETDSESEEYYSDMDLGLPEEYIYD